jgi:hypothetical protein
MVDEGLPLTAECYIDLNWLGDGLPAEIEPEDELAIAALKQYEAAMK